MKSRIQDIEKKESVVHLLLVLTHRFLPWDGPVMMITIPVMAVIKQQHMSQNRRVLFICIFGRL